MGIKNFHKFLRKHSPESYQEVSLSNYSGKTIAVDISIYLFKYKSIHKEKWLNSFLSFLLLFKKHKINCVCIYDTKAPIEKDARKEERKQRKKNAENRILEIQNGLMEYEKSGIVSSILADISKTKGKLKKILHDENILDREAVEKELTNLSNQMVNITKYDIALSKQLMDILGITYYDASSEAETLCAYLCCHNKVDAVLSDDTDVLVYGTPIFLTKLNIRQETCIELKYDFIVEKLNFTKEQFTDLCIMSGTDYNNNITNIGNEKAFSLLQKHKNIETIEEVKKELDTSVLNYRRIREIFEVPKELGDYPIINNPTNTRDLEMFLATHRLQTKIIYC